MSRSGIQILVAMMLGLAIMAPACGAAEVELTAANKSATAQAGVMAYRGEVTLKIPAGLQMQLQAKAMKRERGMEVVRGAVEIKVDKFTVRTEQASIARNEQFTLVKMDAAEVTVAP